MTSGWDTEETWVDKVLHFWGPNNSSKSLEALPLSCYLFLSFVTVCLLTFWRFWTQKEDHIRTRVALRALLTVVAPTCSLWSSRYIKLGRVFRSHIDMPFQAIFRDAMNGIIEFRNPIDDLADLIGSGTTINGHVLRVEVDWKCWIHCFEWWMLAKSTSGSLTGLSDWLHNDTPIFDPSPLGVSLSPFSLTSSTTCPRLCLDRLPHGSIPSLTTGSKVTVEFTAFTPSLRALSAAQVISAVPFTMSDRSRGRPRSLASVLKQLNASHGPNLLIDSVSNVSADYEHALRFVHKSLSEKQKTREMWVKILGIQIWRRDMFLVALEAALVRRRWIERWAIQVTVK